MENQKDKVKHQKKSKVEIGLNLCQKSTVILSLLSCFTTEQGFQNTVFVGNNPVWAVFASFAIQTILLAGILFGVCILKSASRIERVVVIFIWLCAAFVSITFSYICIVNSMYHIDFAVNGDEKLEEFLHNSIKELEQDNLKELEILRPNLVANLKKNGYEVMAEDVIVKARNHVAVTNDYSLPEKEKYLADVEIQFLGNGPYQYVGDKRIKVTRKYAINMYPDSYAKSNKPEYWADTLVNTINTLNQEGYWLYSKIYVQECRIIEKYNSCRKQIQEDGKMPTLDQLKTLVDYCDEVLDNIDNAINTIEEYREENKKSSDGKTIYSMKTAGRYIDNAQNIFANMSNSVKDLQSKINNLIFHSYGEDSKSVDEILALIGSTNADVDELDAARKQMLTSQGSILQKKVQDSEKKSSITEQDYLKEINDLMSDLNTYVDKMEYNRKISEFKTSYLNYTYNIVGDNESYSLDNKVKRTEEKEIEGIINVNPDIWTRTRKIHMAILTRLIFEYPIYDVNQNKTSGKPYQEMINEVYQNKKLYLDTSESEKAYNLLFKEKTYFPYKGKARLSLFFAVFMDIGAALVGFLIEIIGSKVL